jgi:nondiscriminating glutamyl-tRNA synthetase
LKLSESFKKMGILPEALRNYLTLLGWSPADGKTEILSTEELIQQFSLDHIIKSPAVFDQEKLNWLNRHYLKQLPLSRVAELSLPFFAEAGLLTELVDQPVLCWLEQVVEAVINKVDHLSQFPELARLIFEYDAGEAVELLGAEEARESEVLRQVIPEVLAEPKLTYPRFRGVLKEVQKATGKKGKELFHPVRVALTGRDSGPELEKLIPIFEAGSELKLARPVVSVADRLRSFREAAHLL